MTIAIAAATSPPWKDIITTATDGLRTLAILVGGAFAYVKFIRGRVHHPSLEPSLQADIVEVAGVPTMHVTATLLNSGSLRMTFPAYCTQTVRVQCADKALWDDACEHGDVLWDEATGREVDLLTNEGVKETGEVLDPGDSLVRGRLIPLPVGDWVAFRLSFCVDSCSKLLLTTSPPSRWETHIIVLRENGHRG